MTKIQLASAAVAALLIAPLGACAPPAPAKAAVDTGKIADAIKADVAELVVDYNAHDAAKLASHDAPDIVGMTHGQADVVGQATDQAGNQKFFAADPKTHLTDTPKNVEVSAAGDMAIYHSVYTVTYVDPKTKKPVTETDNYVAGYKLQPDGSWKIAWTISADLPPAAAKP